MHDRRVVSFSLLLAAAVLSWPVASHAQSFNGSVSGTIADPSGSPVAGASLVLKNNGTGVELRRTSEGNGAYAFRNLVPGYYQLTTEVTGFQTYVRKGIQVALNGDVRLDVALSVGSQAEEIEVIGASPMMYDTGAKEDGIAPETLQNLPLMFTSGPRSSATFVMLMPGVTTGGTANAFDARINGGMQAGDEAVLDGASMQQGTLSQSGMVSIFQDFPYSPDMVSEIKVVSSSYDAQYGSTTSGQIVATTKSGQDRFHGAVFEYLQNDSLNANQWGATEKSPLEKHNFGANLGGPMKVPGLWSNSVKTYFYVNVEAYRQEGGATRPTLSIPSLKQRAGDFSDWRDSNGNLIPIYDPATTRVLSNGDVIKDPFPGNIIPPSRFSPIALGYLQFLPTPTSDGPLNNYLVPSAIPDTILGDSNYFFGRFDSYIGQKDHIAISLWHQRIGIKSFSLLPHELASEDHLQPPERVGAPVQLGPHLQLQPAQPRDVRLPEPERGLRLREHRRDRRPAARPGRRVVQRPVADELQRRLRHVRVHEQPRDRQHHHPADLRPQRPRHLDQGQPHVQGRWRVPQHRRKQPRPENEQGSFFFGRGPTSLTGIDSGNPIASFLLGAVESSTMGVRTATNDYPRQKAWIFHVGDTWNATSKLTLNLGLRWDYYSPSSEKYDRLGFFDPDGVNPSAGGRRAASPTRGTAGARRATGRGTPRRTGTGASPRASASPTRSTARPSSARVGASSMTARTTPAGAAPSASPASTPTRP